MLRQWGGVTYGLSGDVETRAKLGAIVAQLPAIGGAALFEEAQIELADMVQRAPLDTDPPRGRRGGELRESGRVEGPVPTAEGIEVSIAFGGPNVLYAIKQHQAYYPHDEGQREYMVAVLDASKRYLGARLVRRMEQKLGRVIGASGPTAPPLVLPRAA